MSVPLTQDAEGHVDLPSSWDLSQERQFIENLLCQRFNFLLVFYSLIVAGAYTTSVETNFIAALFMGAVVCTLFSLPVAKAQYRLDSILDVLAKRPGNGCKESQDLDNVDRRRQLVPWLFRWFIARSQRRWIGYWLPLICAASLWVGFVLAWFGVLKPTP
jgi:hypothetical protein